MKVFLISEITWVGGSRRYKQKEAPSFLQRIEPPVIQNERKHCFKLELQGRCRLLLRGVLKGQSSLPIEVLILNLKDASPEKIFRYQNKLSCTWCELE